jgi:hypothetical protein
MCYISSICVNITKLPKHRSVLVWSLHGNWTGWNFLGLAAASTRKFCWPFFCVKNVYYVIPLLPVPLSQKVLQFSMPVTSVLLTDALCSSYYFFLVFFSLVGVWFLTLPIVSALLFIFIFKLLNYSISENIYLPLCNILVIIVKCVSHNCLVHQNLLKLCSHIRWFSIRGLLQPKIKGGKLKK